MGLLEHFMINHGIFETVPFFLFHPAHRWGDVCRSDGRTGQGPSSGSGWEPPGARAGAGADGGGAGSEAPAAGGRTEQQLGWGWDGLGIGGWEVDFLGKLEDRCSFCVYFRLERWIWSNLTIWCDGASFGFRLWCVHLGILTVDLVEFQRWLHL